MAPMEDGQRGHTIETLVHGEFGASVAADAYANRQRFGHRDFRSST